MKVYRLIAIIILFAFSVMNAKDADKPSISYEIQPYYDLKLFRLSVTLEFKGDSSGETRIIIPNEYGGQKQFDGIKNLRATSSNSYIVDTNIKNEKIIKYTPNTFVRLEYQVEEIRHDDIELGNHYQTVIRKGTIHFLGETFFILPDWGDEKEFSFKLIWKNIPSNWSLANSFGVNQKTQEFKTQLWKLRYSIFAGGDFRISKKTSGNNSVFLAIKGKYKFNDNQFLDFTETIIRNERAFWNDFNYPFFLVTVLPISGTGDQAGTGRFNSFALFIDQSRDIDFRLKRVLAHETFHNWVGASMPTSPPEQLVYWFLEGFTDYYARLILLRSKQITFDEYLNDVNSVLEKYAKNPFRYEKNERLVKDFWSDSDLQRIPYFRGDLFAHNLNAAIIKYSGGKKNLDDFMRDLLNRCKTQNMTISNGTLSALIRYFAGETILSDIMRTLNQGYSIKMNPDALGPCVELTYDTSRRFWLIGEEYEIYSYKLREGSSDKKCLEWFNAK
jgi:predicted metalloprotease with PDZ domain